MKFSKFEHVQIEHVQIEHVQVEHVQIEHVQTEHVQLEHVQPEHVQKSGTIEVCFLMVEKASFGVCYDCYTLAVFG